MRTPQWSRLLCAEISVFASDYEIALQWFTVLHFYAMKLRVLDYSDHGATGHIPNAFKTGTYLLECVQYSAMSNTEYQTCKRQLNHQIALLHQLHDDITLQGILGFLWLMQILRSQQIAICCGIALSFCRRPSPTSCRCVITQRHAGNLISSPCFNSIHITFDVMYLDQPKNFICACLTQL